MNFVISIALAAALLTAVVTDLRSQRIHNWLTYPLMLAGIVFHTAAFGLDGLLLAASGFGLGVAVMLPPFLLGMMGAGDVKLMAGIGAWVGPSTILSAFVLTCLAGGVYALAVLLVHRDEARLVLANVKGFLFGLVATRSLSYAPVSAALPRLCYGLAIAVGTVGAVALNLARTGSVLAQ
ncbi:MAG: prepilin peptidase [Pseudodesulfovibrio sp.]